MVDWLDAMEATGDLVYGQDRYSQHVRDELLTISAATIDRHLKPLRDQDPIRGKSATKPGALLRNSISVRKAGDEIEAEPGFFEVDTVAHCGPTLKGEFARTVNFTDMYTGWVFTTAIKNNSQTHIVSAFEKFLEAVPFMVTGIDSDNGSEFINHEVLGWSAQKKIFYTRSRPYQKNDQATIESKNNHLVRRYGFYYRYDTPHQRELLNQLWPLVCDRLNYYTPTKKPIGYTTDAVGRRKRVYDKPLSPYHRLLAAGVLSPAQEAELAAYKASLNVVEIARKITSIQQRLIENAKEPTRRLERELEYAAAAAMPDAEWIKIDQRRARSA
ncbi:DDE-type integrase/transposase/recombinase [Citricoccus muralis]|uniref:DDE-type integrase/transposase/recombinase n=1 Tax=Citricoccus muralis TaxID=169134 RepID=A0ABY8H470_9MICC|nr:DDE-type integrase/transposase/recombinase [Citricoccus muralis]WFP15934.1 DDE-type integrase/transposase/recombinase [Citricoccus muralis]